MNAPSIRRVELTVHPDVLLDPMHLRDAAAKAAGVALADVSNAVIVRKAIDARHGRVRVVVAVDVHLGPDGMDASSPPLPRALPVLTGEPRVVIIGAGPAGLFCAYGLAQLGVRALVLERGRKVRERRHDLAALTQRGELDEDSNYCFGEGGAGTFSDGKLYTRAHKRGPVEEVLRTFAEHGAPAAILVDARPHIGTNKLPAVITSMREQLEAAGVLFRFDARVVALDVREHCIRGVRLRQGDVIDAEAVVVATGHSARDVQLFCRNAGMQLAFKPFALGVRVEHPQAFVDRMQYGALAGHPALGSASYNLVERACGVGVFSFCMCPGGFIVPAASSPGEQVVNGWSPSSRRGRHANSGFVVEVDRAYVDRAGFDASDPLAGVALQRSLEQRAYAAGGGSYVAPAQRLDAFVHRLPARGLPTSSYPRGMQETTLDEILGDLATPLRQALLTVGRKIPGYVSETAVALALESRTSSPVRIERDKHSLESLGVAGVYPCAEGAGYAGGIMSAALDGLRVATAIARKLGDLR